MLVIDEFDVMRLDDRAAEWWLAQRCALGSVEERGVEELLAFMRHHIHPLSAMREALQPHFALRESAPGPYLYRWSLGPELRDAEEQLIAAGGLAATGIRLVGTRRPTS